MPPANQSISSAQTAASQYLIFGKFSTMDTQRAREALPPDRLAWCENLQILADNQLVVVAGPNAPLTTIAGKSITSKFFATYNNIDYLICFTADGAGYQVAINSGVATQFASPGTFSATPDCTQWKSERILIADSVSGYASWDGVAFVHSGTISPVITITNGGSGYLSPPGVTITGGSGAGVVAHAVLTAGVVTSVVVDNPGSGFLPGDVLTVTFSAGLATATAKVWPTFSIKATTVAVFQQRVWLAGGRVLAWTGTKGFDDSDPSNASGSLTISDADLNHFVTALRSLNNYLYIFGDNSIKFIGSISVSGSTTLFTLSTLSSDLGTVFPRSIQSYNRTVLFANKVGVYAIFGASIEKISDPMDGIFKLVDFTQPLQGAINDIDTATRTYLLLVRYQDPVLGLRSLLLAYSAKRWYVMNQGSAIQAITSAPVGGLYETFASSGSDVTQIIQNPATGVAVILRTALADHNKPFMSKRAIRFGIGQNVTGASTVNGTTDTENSLIPFTSYAAALPVTWLNALGQIVTWVNALAQVVTWVGAGFLWKRGQAAGTGIYLGVTITGTFTTLSFNTIVVEYQEATAMVSKPSE